MLTRTEIDGISPVLTNILANDPQWLGGVFAGPEFFRALSVLAGPTSSAEVKASKAIRVCMERQWLEDPCWLESLLRAIDVVDGAGGVGVVANISEIIDRIHMGTNVLDELWHRHWVRDDLPFVDRSSLRDALALLARVGGRPILRIEGNPKTGKSYSRELMEYVSQSAGWSFAVAWVEIREGASFGMNSVKLTQTIVGEMNRSMSLAEAGLTNVTEDDTLLLLNWIKTAAEASGGNRWIFLDGFRFLPAGNSARALIQALGDKIANGNYRQWLRLILVDYDEQLVHVDEEERVVYDRPDPAGVDVDAIEECLRQRCKLKNLRVDDNALRGKAQAILEGFSNNPAYLPKLNKLLQAAGKGLADVKA